MDKETVEIINRLAVSLKIWRFSIEIDADRKWWFKRSGEGRFAQKGLTDKQAVTWLRDESMENLRKLRFT